MSTNNHKRNRKLKKIILNIKYWWINWNKIQLTVRPLLIKNWFPLLHDASSIHMILIITVCFLMYNIKNMHSVFLERLFSVKVYISPYCLFYLSLLSLQFNCIKAIFSNLNIPKWSISNCNISRILSRVPWNTRLLFHSELERITLLTQLPNQLSILQCLPVDTVAVFPTRFAPYWTL